jgi:protein TonB
MAANAEIYFERDRWGRALAWSLVLHGGTVAVLLVYAALVYGNRGDGWGAGGGGDAIGATLVSTVPLPANPAQTQNILANESKGVTKSEPKIQQKEPDAIEIQGKNTKIKPKKQETISKDKPQPEPEPESNQVAFGEGGPVSGPYGSFNAGGAKGGFGVSGGGGDFGTKYAWYVHVIQEKVSENWLKYEVDPRRASI